jgi:hypothetical protein
MRYMVRIRGILPLALCVAMAGCQSKPESFPVSGKIVLAKGDVSQFAGNVIEFQSATDPNVRSYGYVGKDGTFKLATLHQAESLPGVVAGRHKGRFPMDVITGPDGQPLKGKGGLDAKLAGFDTSGWVIDVPVEGDVILKVD